MTLERDRRAHEQPVRRDVERLGLDGALVGADAHRPLDGEPPGGARWRRLDRDVRGPCCGEQRRQLPPRGVVELERNAERRRAGLLCLADGRHLADGAAHERAMCSVGQRDVNVIVEAWQRSRQERGALHAERADPRRHPTTAAQIARVDRGLSAWHRQVRVGQLDARRRPDAAGCRRRRRKIVLDVDDLRLGRGAKP